MSADNSPQCRSSRHKLWLMIRFKAIPLDFAMATHRIHFFSVDDFNFTEWKSKAAS